MAMTSLCGLSIKVEHLIVSIDAVADDRGLTSDSAKAGFCKKSNTSAIVLFISAQMVEILRWSASSI